MSTGNKYVLGYWDIKGLANPLRMALTYAQIPFEDKTFEVKLVDGSWNSVAWKEEYKHMEDKAHAFPNLPYLTLPEGTTLVQSSAILRHIGRVSGLDGANEIERMRSDEVIEQMADFRREIVGASYGDYDTEIKVLLEGTFPYALKIMQKYLVTVGGVYIAGPNVTVADFYMLDVMDLIDKHSKGTMLPQHPALAEYVARVAALPKLAPFFTSPAAKFPANNRMAKWGATSE